MGHGKRGDSLDERQPIFHDQQQTQDKEQVIDTLKDVVKTEAQVLHSRRMPGPFTPQFGPWSGGPCDGGHHAPVEPGQTDKDIRYRRFKPRELDNSTLQRAPGAGDDSSKQDRIAARSFGGLPYCRPG